MKSPLKCGTKKAISSQVTILIERPQKKLFQVIAFFLLLLFLELPIASDVNVRVS